MTGEFKKCLCAIMCAGVLFSLLAGCGSAPTEKGNAELEKRTADYVTEFIAGDFDTFYNASTDEMKAQVTKDKLVSVWQSIVNVTGKPGEIVTSSTRSKGQEVAISTVTCSIYDLAVTVSYSSEGKPSGIWLNYTPKAAPAPQSTDEWEETAVTVGEKKLSGMLTLPKGVEKPPVVILVQGSGPSDMNESVGAAPNRPFEDLAHGLARQGVATLRYNKRTYQYHTESCDTVEQEVLKDAAAAVKLLDGDKRVDSGRIYLLGHSMGGMLAPKIAADNPKIKGIISMAGTLRSLQALIVDQSAASINADTTMTNAQKQESIQKTEDEAAKVATLSDGGTGAILGVPTSYWKSLNEIDLMKTAQNLTVPMLILQGGDDFQVYPTRDYTLWQSALAGRQNVSFKLYDGLSHLFMPNQKSQTGAPDVTVYDKENHVDDTVITDIAAWINAN